LRSFSCGELREQPVFDDHHLRDSVVKRAVYIMRIKFTLKKALRHNDIFDGDVVLHGFIKEFHSLDEEATFFFSAGGVM
jgi:hypothetical protein